MKTKALLMIGSVLLVFASGGVITNMPPDAGLDAWIWICSVSCLGLLGAFIATTIEA